MTHLVSAIMPTRDRERRDWAEQAIECFKAQSYENKELVIVDDTVRPTFDVAPADCVYLRARPMIIPEKRNFLCSIVTGEYIWQLDSDDWSSSSRMALQVQLLETSTRSVCGFSSMLFYDERTGEAFEYRSHADYALGSSLCYRRSWWLEHKWGARPIGSDNEFVRVASKANELVTTAGSDLMVARIHPGNTSVKNPENCVYVRVDSDRIPLAFHASARTHI